MKATARRIVLLAIGAVATDLGLVGILIPILPGFLFFAVAALCFVGASDSLQRRLRRSPRFRPYFERYDRAEGLSEFERVKLAAWLSVSPLFPGKGRIQRV